MPECTKRGETVRTVSVEKCPKTRDTIDIEVRECAEHSECVDRTWESKETGAKPCVECDDVAPPITAFSREEIFTKGFLVNNRGEPANCLFDAYQGASCFLVCGGPSLTTMPLELLDKRGVTVAAVNNVAAMLVRPSLWFSVDHAGSFHESIWRDPSIMKFARRDRSHDMIRSQDGDRWKYGDTQANRTPNVWFFNFGEGFDAETYLTCNPPTWKGWFTLPNGVERDTRSCMLPTLRILFWLGFRTIYLVGADFNMLNKKPYAFHELKDRDACGKNNTTYGVLGHWFHDLEPIFRANGLRVVNVTPGSKLDAFEKMEFTDAIKEVSETVPIATTVRGMYG